MYIYIYIRYNGRCVAICMVRRALSSIGTREGRKNRVENNSRNEDNKRRRKTKERKKGVHTATHDATQARPPNSQPIAVPVC